MIKINDIIEGKINLNSSGSAYLISNKSPKNIYISKDNLNGSLHLDTVKIKILKGLERSLEGRVIEITNRFKTDFVGTIQINDRNAFFIPDSNKLHVDFYIPLHKTMGAKNGEKVLVKLTEWKKDKKNPNGEVIKIIGKAGLHETEIHSILEEYGLPYDFNEDILNESEAISDIITEEEIKKRRDMRDILTFTIDPEDAKDFDDALSFRILTDENLIEVGIHIADVSHYLRPDTQLDKEAFKRGTSVYLVDRCVPMLPERLSNELCSLRPNEDKLCFSVVFKMTIEGDIIDEWFGRTIINSNKRFNYDEAQEIIDFVTSLKNEGKPVVLESMEYAIISLNRIAKKIRNERISDDSISFDKEEIRFKLDKNNSPVDIIFKTSKESNKLIEEFMLLANKKVAELLNSKEQPLINRNHERPLDEKINNINNFIKQFGYKIDTRDNLTIKKSINDILKDIKSKPEEGIISNLIVRSMQKANYNTNNLGHYGLGFKDYTHFTSPIRRYPDVIVHRLLGRYLDSKSKPKLEKIEAKSIYLSQRETLAAKAERDSIKYMQSLYMSNFIGEEFTGIVTSIFDFGLFVEIKKTKATGFIHISSLGEDYIVDVNNHFTYSTKDNKQIKLGDEISVIIDSIDLKKKNINLKIKNG